MQDFTIHNKPLIHISPDSSAGAHAARAHDLSASRSDLSASCCEGASTVARSPAGVTTPVDSSTEFILWNAGLRMTGAEFN